MNPVLVGVVNAILPGLGYLILRKREIFGLLLVIGSLAGFVYGFVEPLMWVDAPLLGTTTLSKTLGAITFLCFPLAFAYDAYQLAKKGK